MEEKSLFDINFRPFYQGLLCLGICTFILLFIWLLNLLGLMRKDPNDIWLIATAILLFFIILNCVFGFSIKNILPYYRESIYTFIGLLILICLGGTFISGTSVFEAASYSWIITVFAIVYIVFMTILGLMRKIMEIVLKQEKKMRDEE
ncbi:MAG: hypothetical protein M3Q56_11655 [Bacteroidota bacterium]|nr:hypothetical protein [Bacteroidota bacterium]